MPIKCPHCEAQIENALTQETHRERLKAKDEENTALKTELKDAKSKAKSADTLAAENATLKADIAKRDAIVERGAAFAEAGIPEGKVRAGFESMYDSAMAGLDEGSDRPSFADWLNSDETKDHPLLSDHYGKASANPQGTPPAKTQAAPLGGKPKTETPPAGKPKGGLPSTDKGGRPASDETVIDSPAKLQAYLQSPEYRALDRKEQRAEVAKLQAQIESAAGQGK